MAGLIRKTSTRAVFAALSALGAAWPAQGPCDVYAAGGTPCVGAFSTIRKLSSAYAGPLYQLRRASDGKTQDISSAADGYADGAAHEAFLGSSKGTFSILYDQSGKGNNLTKAPAGCYTGTASQPDNESDAKVRPVNVAGHKLYALYMVPQDGYRNNKTTGMPTGSGAQGIYEVADGKHFGTACCWDFGNASTNNCNGGTGNMNTLYFGTSYWGKGAGKGPWFMADLEAGVWAGGAKPGDGGWGALEGDHPANPNSPSMTMEFAFGLLKTNASNYAIRVADAKSGNLTTAYDGPTPNVLHWSQHGAIVLGIGGDNSNSSSGTFFEGAITSGRPTDAVDADVLKNVQAAAYGSTAAGFVPGAPAMRGGAAELRVAFDPGAGRASIRFAVPSPGRVSLGIYDHLGHRVAEPVRGRFPAGPREAAWIPAGVPAGVYVARLSLDGLSVASEKFALDGIGAR